MGWIYVLINPAMEGVYKIGRTNRTPEERALELSSNTGVASPFIVVYKQEFTNSEEAERRIHKYLEDCGMRVSKNREFFKGDLSEIIRFIVHLNPGQGKSSNRGKRETQDKAWSIYFEQAENFHFGIGGELENIKEAIKNYQKAYDLGCPISPRRLVQLNISIKPDSKILLLTEGLRRETDKYGCLVELRKIYSETGSYKNALVTGHKMALSKSSKRKNLIQFVLYYVQIESYGLLTQKELSEFKSIISERKLEIESFFNGLSITKLSSSKQRFYGGLVKSVGILINSSKIKNLGTNPTLKAIKKLDIESSDLNLTWERHYKTFLSLKRKT